MTVHGLCLILERYRTIYFFAIFFNINCTHNFQSQNDALLLIFILSRKSFCVTWELTLDFTTVTCLVAFPWSHTTSLRSRTCCSFPMSSQSNSSGHLAFLPVVWLRVSCRVGTISAPRHTQCIACIWILNPVFYILSTGGTSSTAGSESEGNHVRSCISNVFCMSQTHHNSDPLLVFRRLGSQNLRQVRESTAVWRETKLWRCVRRKTWRSRHAI